MRTEISEVDSETTDLRSEIEELKSDIRAEIAQLKVWVAGAGVVIVSVLYAIKFFG